MFGSILVCLIHMFRDLDTEPSFAVKRLLLFAKLAQIFHPAFFLEVQVGLLLQWCAELKKIVLCIGFP